MKCSGRKALQPRNIYQTPKEDAFFVKPKAAEKLKENLNLETSIDASLAEELSAFKKKLERLREDRESTEKLLKERDEAMDLHMSHLLQRGETQKSLEIQVDRLFRLKELHAYSSKISPIRSLRAKEQQEKMRRFTFVINVSTLLSLSFFLPIHLWVFSRPFSGR
ncbi:hypothetical protein ISN45_At05g000940 [Arabidopsis thaliana x Arabidopsis arenosa]|jgi:exonuclease VII large subunit|uniref:Myelin transcription factor n=3 Tax=Arabidopsis TaxID=3701 RepID=B3H7E6_ARATH|nr:myelin transcription factor [Arabidopsis thaliana]AED90409.1 myelin transcription factor [Arabidopsis thaliana]KAG7600845.1 hypothetical protein ISN45_At05g000940 [Arabidopsis thaliana x Arabidopsis arenosa]KAG7607786.1 hypothetical protein ISN44_As05g001000 [Arabidopsis suecica]|eukprot:NP_001119153.1 myelin transcription factor [Arabidopsis thaliana]